MSSQTLKISLEAFVKGLQQVKELGSAIKQSADEAGKLGSGVNKAQPALRSFNDTLKQSREGLDVLTGYVNKAIAAFVAFAAIKGAKETADYAARTETLGVTLGLVASNAGYSAEAIAQYEKELRALGITTQAAREGLTAMIQAGLPLGAQSGQTATNVRNLARAAQDLAVVTGEDSSSTFRRLITNIQQMDTMGLRFMGITVDMEAAQQKFATSLGTTSSALSQQQKVMAANNAVLAEAAKMTGAYEASLETVGKKVSSLKRFQEELRESLGQKLLPAYAELVDGFTEFISRLDKLVQKTDSSKEAAKAFGAEVGRLTGALSEAGLTVAQFLSDNAKLVQLIATNLVGIVTDVVNFANSLLGMATEAGAANAALFALGLTVAGLRDGINVLAALTLSFVGTLESLTGTIIKGWGEIFKLIPGMQSIGEGLVEAGESMLSMGEKSREASDQIGKNFMEGRSAVQSFLDGTNEAKVALADFGKASNVKAVAEEFALLANSSTRASLSASDYAKALSRAEDDLGRLAESGKFTADQFDELLSQARDMGITLSAGFNSGEEALRTIAKQAELTAGSVASIGNSGSFKDLKRSFSDLVLGLSNGAVAGQKAADGFFAAEKALARFKDENPKAAKEIAELTKLIASAGEKIRTEYDAALKAVGITMAEVASGMSAKTAEMVDGLVKLAANARTTAEVMSVAFSKGIADAKDITTLAAISKAIDTAREKAEAFKAVGDDAQASKWLIAAGEAADQAKAKFEALFQESLKTTTTEEGFRRLKESITVLGVSMGKTSEQIVQDIGRIERAQATAAANMKQAGLDSMFKSVGISAEEAQGKASKAIQGMIEGLRVLGTALGRSSQEFQAAFAFDVAQAKTLGDLRAFAAEAQRAFSEGASSAAAFSEELNRVNARFQEIVASSIKLAKTPEDFARLAKSIQESGVSATVMASALAKVQEAAKGAAGDVLQMAKNMTEAEAAATRIAKAELEVQRAASDVQKAKAATLVAELNYKRTGSELDKAILDNAKAQQAVAQAKLELTRAKYQEELASMDALIAKQKVLNANKDLEANAGNPVYEAKAAAAEREAKATQVQAEAAKQATQAAEQNLIASEKNAIATQDVADNLKEGAEAAKQAAAGAAQANKQFLDGMAEMFNTINNSGKAMEDLGYSAAEAAEIMAEAKRNAFAAPPLGLSQAIDNLFQVMDNLNKKAEEFKQQMGAAEEFAANYEATAAAAEAMANAAGSAAQATSKMGSSIDAVSAVYAKVEASAWRIVDASIKSGEAFANSTSSIREELLRAQGKEEEVARIRFASRQKELAMEYKLLDVKLLAAEITAKAAGIKDTGIENARREANAAYQQAKQDLGELEKLELAKIQKTKQEQAAKDRDATAAAAKRQQEAAAQAAASKAIDAAKSGSSVGGVAAGKGVGGSLVESAGGKGVSSTTINVNVDGKDLLSEDQIRKKIVPTLDAIAARSK